MRWYTTFYPSVEILARMMPCPSISSSENSFFVWTFSGRLYLALFFGSFAFAGISKVAHPSLGF